MKLKNTLVKTGLLVAACLCFVLGCIIGNNSVEKITDTENTAVFIESSEAKQLEKEVKTDEILPTYSIILENDFIYLYEVVSGEKNIIAQKQLLSELLPTDDVLRLRDGIESDDCNEALRIWEGYVS